VGKGLGKAVENAGISFICDARESLGATKYPSQIVSTLLNIMSAVEFERAMLKER
jgi:hypothetical protein